LKIIIESQFTEKVSHRPDELINRIIDQFHATEFFSPEEKEFIIVAARAR
jgi:hypothetical protein